MNKYNIRKLIKEYKQGLYKDITLRQAYILARIRFKELTVKESQSLLK